MSLLPLPMLHAKFLDCLGLKVISHSDIEIKPLEVDLNVPFPSKIRLYLYNLTDPPGGRTLGELKIQLIVPGQKRKAIGELNTDDNRIILLGGYNDDLDVFVFWDSGFYFTFKFSRNIQIYTDAINTALAGKIGIHERKLRGNKIEKVVAVRSDMLLSGIEKRMQLTLERLVD